MKLTNTLAFLGAAAVTGAITACIPQPPLECNPFTPYWAQYKLVSGTGTCSTYTGDIVAMQRYLAPGSNDATIAVLPRRVGALNRVPAGRVDLSDPEYRKESAIGKLASLTPDSSGVCKVQNIAPTDRKLEALQTTKKLPDGGIADAGFFPEVAIKYAWSDIAIKNTAELPGTLFKATLDVTLDSCSAKYEVYGVHPLIGCSTDEDCNPEPNPDAGRILGSGMSASYKPKCQLEPEDAYREARVGAPGVCMPSIAFDDLPK